MNVGIISARYAEALLKYVSETGNGETVYRQAHQLAGCFSALEDMRALIKHPKSTPDDQKLDVFVTAVGGKDKAAPELVRFICLVMKHRRIGYLHLMLLIFMEKYRHAENIRAGKLTVAVPSVTLKRRLEDIVHDETGGTLELETKVDPSIIGGFIFDMEGSRLDASVASQLKAVRRQFIEKNRRIV